MRRIGWCCWLVGLVLWAGTLQAAESRTAQRPVKLRAGPAVFHPVLERLEVGASLTVIEDGQRWVKVRTGSGQEGWVSARVFSRRPKPRGYGAVLEQRPLTGASSAVSTMASRGLTVQGGPGPGALQPLVADFLERVPFAPEQFETFVGALSPNPICERLPGWLGELGQPLPGDPERDEQERLLGLKLAGRVLQKAELITDPALDAYVNQVGSAVAAASSRYDLPWRFVIFAQQRPEAFAAPGGFVFLSSGLLGRLADEAELAGVLGHLVAHVALGHGAAELEHALGASPAPAGAPAARGQAELVDQAQRLLRTARGAQAEREADAYGATYAACAGYDPAGLAAVLERLGAFEPGADGAPPVAERTALIAKVRRAAGPRPGRRLPERYRRAVLARAP